MSVAKLTYHLEMEDGRHFVLIPDEDLEPTYRIVGLNFQEVDELVEKLGPTPKWLRRLYFHRELRDLLPDRSWFRRTSRAGVFGCESQDGGRIMGEVRKGYRSFFGNEFLPGGYVVRVESYPETRPDLSCRSLDVEGPSSRKPLSTGTGMAPPFPDFVFVEITNDGRAKLPSGTVYDWTPTDKREPERVLFLKGLNPSKTALIRCVDEFERYLAFQLPGVLILIRPVKAHAAFYRPGEDLDPEVLTELNRKAIKARGFKIFRFIEGWQGQLREIAQNGSLIRSITNLPLTTRILNIDQHGHVHIAQGVYAGPPSSRIDPERILKIWHLRPAESHLVRLVGDHIPFAVFKFASGTTVLIRPVVPSNVFFSTQGGDVSKLTEVSRGQLLSKGFQPLPHIGMWEKRLEEVVRYGRPLTYSGHGKWVRRE